jgi:hypothetical protein
METSSPVQSPVVVLGRFVAVLAAALWLPLLAYALFYGIGLAVVVVSRFWLPLALLVVGGVAVAAFARPART